MKFSDLVAAFVPKRSEEDILREQLATTNKLSKAIYECCLDAEGDSFVLQLKAHGWRSLRYETSPGWDVGQWVTQEEVWEIKSLDGNIANFKDEHSEGLALGVPSGVHLRRGESTSSGAKRNGDRKREEEFSRSFTVEVPEDVSSRIYRALTISCGGSCVVVHDFNYRTSSDYRAAKNFCEHLEFERPEIVNTIVSMILEHTAGNWVVTKDLVYHYAAADGKTHSINFTGDLSLKPLEEAHQRYGLALAVSESLANRKACSFRVRPYGAGNSSFSLSEWWPRGIKKPISPQSLGDW